MVERLGRLGVICLSIFRKIQILEKFRFELCKKISISVKHFAKSRHWKFGIGEIFCRIQIFEIATMQLAIKDHDPMAECQDDGTA